MTFDRKVAEFSKESDRFFFLYDDLCIFTVEKVDFKDAKYSQNEDRRFLFFQNAQKTVQNSKFS